MENRQPEPEWAIWLALMVFGIVIVLGIIIYLLVTPQLHPQFIVHAQRIHKS